jgi:uncharacterized Fe-S center protein
MKSTAPQSATNAQLETRKEEVLERIAESKTKVLTREEQISIINFVSRSGAKFTPDETASITKALRAQ